MRLSPQKRAGKASLLIAAIALGFLVASCSDSDEVTPPDTPQQIDFTLTDVNLNSDTYNQRVSIRSFRGQPLVFYVGKAG